MRPAPATATRTARRSRSSPTTSAPAPSRSSTASSPATKGRGYVLRRITRRAIRHGYKLGARKPFFHKLVADLAAEMGDAYPELRRDRQRATDVLKQEEERFFQTIANGMEILEGAIAALPRGARACWAATSPSSCTTPTASRSTSPPTSAASAASRSTPPASRSRWRRQREQARAAGKFKVAQGLEYSGAATTFHGYGELVRESAKVVALYVDGSAATSAKAGDDAVIVLDHTPFYAESGGQVGDTGELRNATSRVIVEDTVKIQAAVFGHEGRVVEGEIKVGDTLGREGRRRAPREDRAQPQRDPPDAQGAARGARRARAAEGLARRRRAHALRLRPQRAADRRADPPRRAARQRRDPREPRDHGARHADRRGAEARRDDAVRREVRRRGARARHRLEPRALRRHARGSAPATSASSRSSPRAASPPASAASRR